MNDLPQETHKKKLMKFHVDTLLIDTNKMLYCRTLLRVGAQSSTQPGLYAWYLLHLSFKYSSGLLFFLIARMMNFDDRA